MDNHFTKDLVRRIEFALELQGKTVALQGILRILNIEQRKIANELHFPIRYAKNLPTDRPFSVPVDANQGGMRYFESALTGIELEVLTVHDANRLYPNWETNYNEGTMPYTGDGAPFVIYDPVNVSAPIYPVAFKDGDTIRALYVLRPEELLFNDTSVVFRGELREYSPELLYNAVMTDLCFNLGDQRYTGFYNQLQYYKELAFNYSRPELYVAKLRGETDETKRYF